MCTPAMPPSPARVSSDCSSDETDDAVRTASRSTWLSAIQPHRPMPHRAPSRDADVGGARSRRTVTFVRGPATPEEAPRMDERSIDEAPARPYGGVPLDRNIDVLAAIPRQRSDSGSTAWSTVPVGRLPTDDDLIERTLAFSGSYVSDDGHLAIRRTTVSRDYSGHRFVGYCRT